MPRFRLLSTSGDDLGLIQLAAPDWSHRPDAFGQLINGWVLDIPAAEEYLKQLPNDRNALLQLYAQRAALSGHSFPAPDVVFREFEETFPFEETRDQLGAVEEVKQCVAFMKSALA